MCILKGVGKIHMIGIGGAGMCAMAAFLRQMGYSVKGSDSLCSDNTMRLEAQGITVFYGHSPENIGDADICVYSAAIEEDNAELCFAKSKIPVYTRAEMLGEITALHKCSVVISGTHGKTTATAALSEIIIKSGASPSAIIGGHLPLIHSGGILGNGETIVCEGCEFAKTFLQLKRDIGVILNIDNDHLEQYGSIEGLKKAFKAFARDCETVVLWGDSSDVTDCGDENNSVVTFGFAKENTYRAIITDENKAFFKYDILKNGVYFTTVNLKLPGRHNILNTLAAAVCADLLGVEKKEIGWSLSSFGGVSRRFEILSTAFSITVADDYAHHPSEIRAVLETAKSMGFDRVVAVFQPFTFSRTRLLMEDFASALSLADRVYIEDIMGGREKNLWNVSSAELCERIPQAFFTGDHKKTALYAAAAAQKGDIIITLGCGNVYKCARMIKERIINKSV